MNQNGDWRWIFRLGARVLGYALVGYLVFVYLVVFAVLALGQISAATALDPRLTVFAGLPAAIFFGYGALRSKPQQGGESDSGMLFNLIFWTVLTLIFGCVLLWFGLSVYENILKLPATPASWDSAFARVRWMVVFGFCVGFQALGVHLALSRVARRVAEEAAKTPQNLPN